MENSSTQIFIVDISNRDIVRNDINQTIFFNRKISKLEFVLHIPSLAKSFLSRALLLEDARF